MVLNSYRVNQYRDKLNKAIDKSNLAEMFSSLMTMWVEAEATDIYFEPFEDYWIIGIRVDWFPDELIQYPKNLHDSIISKFKIESGQMNPNVSDMLQEAKVCVITDTYKEANILAKIVPTALWEKLEMHMIKEQKKETNPSLW